MTAEASPTRAEAPQPRRGLGERKLSTVHAVAQALAIGPMFSTALVLGIVSNPATGAGFNAALAVVVAAIGVLAIGFVVTLYARQYAGAGAIYEYLAHGATPAVGVLMAGFFFLGELFLASGSAYLGIGILSHDFWSAHITDSAPPFWVFALIAMAIVVGFNHLGIRLAIRAMLTFAAISFIPLLILAIAIIVQGGDSGNTLAPFDPSTTSLGTVFSGVLLGILLFIGFEAAASIGEESSDPHRSIPRAVIITITIAGLFYVLMAYAFSIGFGEATVTAGGFAGDPAYIDTLATRYVGSGLATIIDLVVILDAMGLALALCAVVARGFFALSRDGLMPSALARVSRHNTPWVANLVVSGGCVFFILLASFASYGKQFGLPSDELATFILVATIGSYVVEFVYLALAAVAIRLLLRMRGTPGQWWRWLITLVAIATPILAFKGALGPGPHTSANLNWVAFFWAIALAVVSVAWFAAMWTLRRRSVQQAGRHALGDPAGAPTDPAVGLAG